jgi:hypothetical protein
MKKILGLTAVGVAVAAVSIAAWAADINNINGQSCGALSGTWHFVNNQTRGAADGILTAVISGATCTAPAVKNTGSTQHFYCVDFAGTLESATTGSLPGRLVLSDFSCSGKPPPCDPKKEVCPK